METKVNFQREINKFKDNMVRINELNNNLNDICDSLKKTSSTLEQFDAMFEAQNSLNEKIENNNNSNKESFNIIEQSFKDNMEQLHYLAASNSEKIDETAKALSASLNNHVTNVKGQLEIFSNKNYKTFVDSVNIQLKSLEREQEELAKSRTIIEEELKTNDNKINQLLSDIKNIKIFNIVEMFLIVGTAITYIILK